MHEREVKLLVDPDAAFPPAGELLAGVGRGTVEYVDQEAVYYDTPDLRLTRAGVSLRYRSDDGWTVKLPESRDDTTLVRNELHFPGDLATGPPSAATDLVCPWVRSATLAEVARIRTRRHKTLVTDKRGRPVAEIDDDEVIASVVVPVQSRFREVEVELAEGADPGILDRLAKRLRKAGARGGHAMPKIARVLGDPATAPPDVVVPEGLDRDATLTDVVRAAISRSTAQLVEHDPVVRIGEDLEGVHKARRRDAAPALRPADLPARARRRVERVVAGRAQVARRAARPRPRRRRAARAPGREGR